MPVSVFERMSLAAARHGAVNLGQGFPDFGWPEPILEAGGQALREGSNQYAPSRGVPELRKAVADHYGRHHGMELGPDNILITSGATEAIAASIFALVQPGDEVVIFAPAYDAYAPLVRRAGGVVREVPLRPPEWRIEQAALETAVSTRTRAIVLNNPHNPTGRLFTPEELESVAAVARAYDLLVLSDEVWEHVLLDDRSFTPFASLPGMGERTLKCGSAGKIFSLTGWKVGWLVADSAVIDVVARAHQFLTFATATNLQAAVAFGMREGDAWLHPMRRSFTEARDRLTAGLKRSGYAVLPSASTYFLCVDLSASGLDVNDEEFAAVAVEHAGVAVIPISAFFEEEPARHLVRLCFAKRPETIDQGIAAMDRAMRLLARR
nr:aminotransferase [Sphingomonas arenae]